MDGLKVMVPFDPDVTTSMDSIAGFAAPKTRSLPDFIMVAVGDYLQGIMAADKFYQVLHLPDPIPKDTAKRLMHVCAFFRRWSLAKMRKPDYHFVALTVRERLDPPVTYVMEREANAGRMILPIRVVDVEGPSELRDGRE